MTAKEEKTAPYIPIHGFIVEGEFTNSPDLLIEAVRYKRHIVAVDSALLGLIFKDGIPEELLTFAEPMFELSFETGLLRCLDIKASFGAVDAWIHLSEATTFRYKCLPKVRVKIVARVVLDVSHILVGVTTIAEKIGVDFANSGKDFVYATEESDFLLLALLCLSSTIPFYSHPNGVDGDGFQVHISLFSGDVPADSSYTLLATSDNQSAAIYSTDYVVDNLTGYLIDSNEFLPVVYVKEGAHCAAVKD